MEAAEAGADAEDIDLNVLAHMLGSGLSGLQEIVQAQVGDKTLVDTLSPAVNALREGVQETQPIFRSSHTHEASSRRRTRFN